MIEIVSHLTNFYRSISYGFHIHSRHLYYEKISANQLVILPNISLNGKKKKLVMVCDLTAPTP